jgi:hypothetical protein
MSDIIGNLKPNEGTSYVTFKEAKRQIRELAKACDLKLGAFRPRRENKRVLQVALADGSGVVTATRAPAAPVTIVRTLSGDDIPEDLLAEIEAENVNHQR